MADKIIIDKKPIEPIDISKIDIPVGYIIIEDPAVKIAELKQIEIEDLQKIIAEPVPSDEELIEWGKTIHPYYEALNRFGDL